MNHDNRLRGRIALLAVGLLITLGGIATTFPGGPAQAQLAPNAPSIYRAVPLDTPSPTPSSGEPEWDILQYVATTHPQWTCGAIGGSPGHRTLGCYTGAGHGGSGTVDNYGDPASASANWQQRRTQAQAAYALFQNTAWTNYPGYHGEGPRPPYNFFTQEDYYWADVRVLGGIRVDDTNFHYAPDIATAIMQAATALGYLPPPSPTPTADTPTATTTLSPSPTPTGTSTPSATTTGTPCSLQFTDVPASSPFYTYIRCLACRGIVGGYPCGGPGEPCPGAYFRPSANVTRGQVSKIVAEAAQWSDPVPSTQQTFEDVPPGSTFALWVERLGTRGIIGGYPCGGPFEPCVSPANRPYFRPGNNVTRGQLAKITSGAAGWTETPTAQTFEDVPPGSPFYLPIERLTARSIITGYPCGGAGEPCIAPANRPYFRPNSPATRGQISKIAAQAFFPACQTPARR